MKTEGDNLVQCIGPSNREDTMSFEQFMQIFLRQREGRPAQNSAEQELLDPQNAEAGPDVGTVRLSRLEAALRQRRAPGAEE
jgi:hypothetical protein